MPARHGQRQTKHCQQHCRRLWPIAWVTDLCAGINHMEACGQAREVKSSGRVCSVAVRLLLAKGKPQLLLHISKYDHTSMSNIPSENEQIIVALACSVAVLSMPLPSPKGRAMIGRGLGYGHHGRSCCSHKVWQRKSADDANKKALQQWCSS